MVNNKSQIEIITGIIGIILVIGIIFFSIFILKNVKNVESEVTNNLDSKSNVTDKDFGEPIKGSSDEEILEKIKDSNIAPPELSG